MKKYSVISLKGVLAAGLLASSGCLTVLDPGASRATREREDVLILRENDRRLQGRVESLELQVERLLQDMDRLQDDQRRRQAGADEQLDGRLAQVEKKIQAVDAARAKDREEIIDKLSSKITQVMSTSSGSSSRSRPRGGTGYEHTVDTGQTLSEIARAYGVTMQAIIRENELQNPDALRVGQKLFIPE